jgi:transcriptional regulator with XRE-family HTH domain
VNLIGRKLKQYRKDANMSQLDLELAIDAASGTISRIESGKTNPSKETLANIASALQLKPIEVQYLFSNSDEISDEEKEYVIGLVSSLLDSNVHFCYLLDMKSRYIEISKGLRSFFNTKNVDSDNLIGHPLEEVLFDPQFGIRDLIGEEQFENVAYRICSTTIQKQNHMLKDEWWDNHISFLNELPDFTRLYQKAMKEPDDIYSEESRTIDFNLKGLKIKTVYHANHLYTDPRFTLVEFRPQDTGIKLIQKLLR